MFLLISLLIFLSCGNGSTDSSDKSGNTNSDKNNKNENIRSVFELTPNSNSIKEDIIDGIDIYSAIPREIKFKVKDGYTSTFYNVSYDEFGEEQFGEELDVTKNDKEAIIKFDNLDEGIYSLLVAPNMTESNDASFFDASTFSIASDLTPSEEIFFINFIGKDYFSSNSNITIGDITITSPLSNIFSPILNKFNSDNIVKLSINEEAKIESGKLTMPSVTDIIPSTISIEPLGITFGSSDLNKYKDVKIEDGEIDIKSHVNNGNSNMYLIYRKVIDFRGQKYYSDKMFAFISFE